MTNSTTRRIEQAKPLIKKYGIAALVAMQTTNGELTEEAVREVLDAISPRRLRKKVQENTLEKSGDNDTPKED